MTALSYSHGTGGTTLPGDTVVANLGRAVAARPTTTSRAAWNSCAPSR
ncbi:hypothetical protein [Streptomyces sp. BSE7-9]|nr:hypothetical protein [Streptomyces sp. BSE7-9]MBJ6643019.1 hypothetical protein [Streptomyces sp. BSE7-9]